VEIDATNAHRLLRQREAAGEDLSFTAFLIHGVARAVDEDRIMHAYRRRGQLILFDDVDVNAQIEAAVGGQLIVQSLLIRSANRKSVEQLSSEIRAAQRHDARSKRRYRGALAFLSLPRPVRAWPGASC
jgi:pyruvate/2-oxoglutarate dehydrogenase complex dihydrolipoamide acyltransferase (E2) component